MPDVKPRCKACGAIARLPVIAYPVKYNDPNANPRGPLVYMIEVMAGGVRMTKIGYTAGLLNDRVRTIQTSTPGKIVVRGWIFADISVETMLHEYAHAWWDHAHGEWFDSSKEPDAFDYWLEARAVCCRDEMKRFMITHAMNDDRVSDAKGALAYTAYKAHNENAERQKASK